MLGSLWSLFGGGRCFVGAGGASGGGGGVGVEGVAEAVAEEVDAEDGKGDGEAGPDDAVRGEGQERDAVVEQAAPGGEVGRESEAQEAQRALGGDRGGDVEGGGDHDRAEGVGKHVTADNAPGAGADGAGGGDVLAGADGEHLAAHDAGGLHPARDADNAHHQDEYARLQAERGAQRFAEQHGGDHQQGQHGQGQEQVGVKRISGPSRRRKKPDSTPITVPTVSDRAIAPRSQRQSGAGQDVAV